MTTLLAHLYLPSQLSPVTPTKINTLTLSMLSLGNMENAPPPQAPGLISNQVPPSAPGRYANAAPPSSSSQFTNPTSAPPPVAGYGVTTTPGAPSFYPPPPGNQNQTGKGRFTSEMLG